MMILLSFWMYTERFCFVKLRAVQYVFLSRLLTTGFSDISDIKLILQTSLSCAKSFHRIGIRPNQYWPVRVVRCLPRRSKVAYRFPNILVRLLCESATAISAKRKSITFILENILVFIVSNIHSWEIHESGYKIGSDVVRDLPNSSLSSTRSTRKCYRFTDINTRIYCSRVALSSL